MPARIKFIFSIAVVLTAIAAYFFQAGLGHAGPSYASLSFRCDCGHRDVAVPGSNEK